MTFSEYVKTAFEELQSKQELLVQKIGHEFLDFEPDDLAGKIRFYHKETKETHAEFGVALVGTYHLHNKTWQWAWGHPNLSHDDLITLVRQISKLAEAFPDEKAFMHPAPFEADRLFGQNVTAALVKLLEGKGMYKCQCGDDNEYEIYRVLL
jgi:hypothetical protein